MEYLGNKEENLDLATQNDILNSCRAAKSYPNGSNVMFEVPLNSKEFEDAIYAHDFKLKSESGKELTLKSNDVIADVRRIDIETNGVFSYGLAIYRLEYQTNIMHTWGYSIKKTEIPFVANKLEETFVPEIRIAEHKDGLIKLYTKNRPFRPQSVELRDVYGKLKADITYQEYEDVIEGTVYTFLDNGNEKEERRFESQPFFLWVDGECHGGFYLKRNKLNITVGPTDPGMH